MVLEGTKFREQNYYREKLYIIDVTRKISLIDKTSVGKTVLTVTLLMVIPQSTSKFKT